MKTGLLIVAHTPLASALRACVLHVLPEAKNALFAIDVLENDDCAKIRAMAQKAMLNFESAAVLIFTDIEGASPCNATLADIPQKHIKLISGVNLPMLLRAVNYAHESIEDLVDIALQGGIKGIKLVK